MFPNCNNHDRQNRPPSERLVEGRHLRREGIYHKDVVGVGDLSSYSKKFQQIVELSMDITTYGNGRSHGLDVRLLEKELLYLLNQKDIKIDGLKEKDGQ